MKGARFSEHRAVLNRDDGSWEIVWVTVACTQHGDVIAVDVAEDPEAT